MQYKIYLIFNMVLTVILLSCSENSSSLYTEEYITANIKPIHKNISNPYERWKAYSLDNYEFSYIQNCFCYWGGKEFKVVVRNGILYDVYDPDGEVLVDTSQYSLFRTINQLFDFTDDIDPNNVASFTHEYDSLYGYPSKVWVDYNYQMADEEFGFWVFSVQEIIKFN